MLKKKPIPRSIALAACAFALTAGAEIQLLPAGEFRSSDGRPKDVPAWRIDAGIAAALIAEVEARANRLVLDYEHQTLLSADNGQPAPAAGWFKKLEWREGDGLYAIDVQWTERAAAMIAAGEYLYLSPVFSYDKKTGAVLRLVNAALTNNPALDGMDAVAARFLADGSPDGSGAESLEEIHQMPELLKKMLAAIGLQEDATETAALAALAALKTKADQVGGLETEVTALKSAAPDLSKYVPVETMTELRNQVATLTAQLNGKTVDDLVEVALSEGRLLPAQESWARDLGKSNLAALTQYLDTAQPIAALAGTQTGGRQPAGGQPAGELSDAQLAVCKQMGVAPEDYKKTLQEQAA